MRTAKKRRRAMLTRGPMAFAIELITTCRPAHNTQIFISFIKVVNSEDQWMR
jgi:hypothetical protein